MSKFTPGPWKWFETENGDARVNPQNGGLVIAQPGQQGAGLLR